MAQTLPLRQCVHIKTKRYTLHSTLISKTVPPDQNTTSYEYNERMELCPFCVGMLQGWLSSERGLNLEKPQ